MIWTICRYENYGDRSWWPELHHYHEHGWHSLDVGWFKCGFTLQWRCA